MPRGKDSLVHEEAMGYRGFEIVKLLSFYRVMGHSAFQDEGDGWYKIDDFFTLEAAKEYIDKILDN